MLEPKMVKNSLSNHSPAIAKGVRPTKHDHAAGGIVGKAQNDLKNNQPRDQKQNQKPGHETQRGNTPKQR